MCTNVTTEISAERLLYCLGESYLETLSEGSKCKCLLPKPKAELITASSLVSKPMVPASIRVLLLRLHPGWAFVPLPPARRGSACAPV